VTGPLQPGGVPLWISGTVNPRVVNRLARFGTGWIPWGPAAADVTDFRVAMHLPATRPPWTSSALWPKHSTKLPVDGAGSVRKARGTLK
jgi:hypothetical protein